MNRTDVIAFFDKMAPAWDAKTIRREHAIAEILDLGGIKRGVRVLDVGCGTGVLFPDYLQREVQTVCGIDISSEMLNIARKNFSDSRIRLLCADAETLQLPETFDCIMIHNAFPHFLHPAVCIQNLSALLAPQGRLTVAHSMSRAEIDRCHAGKPQSISQRLPDENELAQLFRPYLQVDIAISDSEKYIVSGILNKSA